LCVPIHQRSIRNTEEHPNCHGHTIQEICSMVYSQDLCCKCCIVEIWECGMDIQPPDTSSSVKELDAHSLKGERVN
jgi:hypothetical protein